MESPSIYSANNSALEANRSKSSESSLYVRGLLEKKISDLENRLTGMRSNDNSQENNSQEIKQASLEDQLKTLRELIKFMDNKNNERNVT